MEIKKYSIFPQSSTTAASSSDAVYWHILDIRWRIFLSVDMQPACSTAAAKWAIKKQTKNKIKTIEQLKIYIWIQFWH